jgi:hypothetical protein
VSLGNCSIKAANIYRTNTRAVKAVIRRSFNIYFAEAGTLYLIERYLAMHVSDIQRNGMFKPTIRVAVAAAIVGLFVFVASAAPMANMSVDPRPLPQVSAKGDRLPLHVKGAACSQRAWPHFEQRCQFDFRNPESEARSVRVIALR